MQDHHYAMNSYLLSLCTSTAPNVKWNQSRSKLQMSSFVLIHRSILIHHTCCCLLNP